MPREQKQRPSELWMATVTTERLSDGHTTTRHFGPFGRRGDAVGAATRAKRRSDLHAQTVEYYSTECRWQRRV